MDSSPLRPVWRLRQSTGAALPAGLSPRLVLFSFVLLFVGIDVRIAIELSGAQPLGVDWSPLWAAARLPAAEVRSLYDFAAITQAQEPLIGTISGVRPFVYPPSALIIFLPFAMLPILPSYLAWIGATGTFYLAAASRLSELWWLLLVMPPVVLAGLIGQTGFLIGGLIVTGLHLLDRYPAWAGAAFGVATAVKPQMLILVPIALIVAQHWRALLFWGASGIAMVLLSMALFGIGVWIDWVAALPRFQAVIQNNPTLLANAIAPYALAQRLGHAGWWVFAPVAALASAAVWVTFRRGDRPADRLIALVGGAIMLSPYAMNYELALIAPALVAGAISDGRRAALLHVVALSLLLGFGFWGLLLAMIAVIAQSDAAMPALASATGSSPQRRTG
jgi:hypothetical protein